MRKAVFLDRDGTLNFDPGYLGDPEKFRFFPGVIEALRRLREAGFLLFIASNQSGIARGLFREEDLKRIHAKMNAALRDKGIELNGIYYCPHHPDERCACRKPSPKMVRDAAAAHGIDLSNSFFVGDRITDIETGRNAGCRTILVLTGAGEETRRGLPPTHQPDFIARNLSEAVGWIIEKADQQAEAAGGKGGQIASAAKRKTDRIR